MTESQPPTLSLPGSQSTRRLNYIAFDPGKRTGVAGWDDPALPPILMDVMEETQRDAFFVSLENRPPKVIILEPYRVWNHKFNHEGNKLYTSRVIGQIEAFCRRYGVKIIEVQPSLKSTAAQWAGVKIPKGHMPDMLSAFLLGYYHLRITNLAPSRLLQERKANGQL